MTFKFLQFCQCTMLAFKHCFVKHESNWPPIEGIMPQIYKTAIKKMTNIPVNFL